MMTILGGDDDLWNAFGAVFPRCGHGTADIGNL